ncbi:H-NS family histone-like protein [Vibrio rotiferianus]|uniref:H-NS family histone-like protein n=1 Tax=Vibrio rotiferianus TaxID=190895 RepID=UPI00390C096D
MADLKRILLNLRSLRAYSRDLSTEQLIEALDKLSFIVEERRKGAVAEKEKQDEFSLKLSNIAKQINTDGIDITDLISLLSKLEAKKPRANRTPRPAKYKYVNYDGQEKTWTGQGRTPIAIQEQLDKGISIDEFLISRTLKQI